MRVQVLYVDGCRHRETLEERVRDALVALGRTDPVESILVATPEQAHALAFHGSPSVLLDGTDPFAVPDAPVGLACRLYQTPEGLRGAPAPAQVLEAFAAR